MKREAKTELTKEKIISAALQEFGINGYDAASVNAVCERHHISKGLIYHNFHSKDEIYLVCVDRVFCELTEYIHKYLGSDLAPSDEKLQAYHSARTKFFDENPSFLRIFCEAVVFPPPHLEESIGELRRRFDSVNAEVVRKLTSDLHLRLDISEPKLIDTFCRSFDLIDAVSQMRLMRRGQQRSLENGQDLPLDILLYGMLER